MRRNFKAPFRKIFCGTGKRNSHFFTGSADLITVNIFQDHAKHFKRRLSIFAETDADIIRCQGASSFQLRVIPPAPPERNFFENLLTSPFYRTGRVIQWVCGVGDTQAPSRRLQPKIDNAVFLAAVNTARGSLCVYPFSSVKHRANSRLQTG